LSRAHSKKGTKIRGEKGGHEGKDMAGKNQKGGGTQGIPPEKKKNQLDYFRGTKVRVKKTITKGEVSVPTSPP